MDSRTAAPVPGLAPTGGRLRELVVELAHERRREIRQARATLLLTDAEGVVLGLWPGDERIGTMIERAGIAEGAYMGEARLGTSSVSALVSYEPTLVVGDQHFAEVMRKFASAGMVMRHPVTRRVTGSVHLITEAITGSALALPWVCELAREVTRSVRVATETSERLLLDAYLSENREGRHAVVAINRHNIVTNASAARLVGVEEQTVLWEHASRVVSGEQEDSKVLQVGRGMTLRVHCAPVRSSSGAVVGVIMRLKRLTEPSAVGPLDSRPALPGLAGSGANWTSTLRRVRAIENGSMLLVGERGTGRAAIARALAQAATVAEFDAASAPENLPRWLGDLSRAASESSVVLIRHIDVLPCSAIAEVVEVLGGLPTGTRGLATSAIGPGHGGGIDRVLDRFSAVVHVPPLRERHEDIPELVKSLTARFVSRQPRLGAVEWMSDALQALSRSEWPGNVAELASVVEVVLAESRTGYIGAKDLPPDLMARATKRRLTGLERIEAGAILQALRHANGNKCQAAEDLGIARSTLYRKMRALGVDLRMLVY